MSEYTTAFKFSVSIPARLSSFVERYQQEHGVSRSEVIARGLERLYDEELASAYREHAEAWEEDPDRAFWDAAAVDDGLDDGKAGW